MEGVAAYKGIRYATAGRWECPRQVTSWEGTYDATNYGSCAYQARAFYDEAKNPKKHFYYTEFRKGETYTYSEDCLILNIWTPDTTKTGDKLAVLVYIHGGNCGAWHSADLWYWFGTLPNCWCPWEQKDYALSDLMTDYLTAFAKRGNPNYTGRPEWVAAGDRAMCMGEKKAYMGRPNMLKLVYIMLTNKSVDG